MACRICLVNSQGLIHPCDCTDGVCKVCLNTWINYNGVIKRRCDVCQKELPLRESHSMNKSLLPFLSTVVAVVILYYIDTGLYADYIWNLWTFVPLLIASMSVCNLTLTLLGTAILLVGHAFIPDQSKWLIENLLTDISSQILGSGLYWYFTGNVSWNMLTFGIGNGIIVILFRVDHYNQYFWLLKKLPQAASYILFSTRATVQMA